MQAFPNTQEPVFRLTDEILQTGFSASRESPRHRIILPLHRQQDASVQRMLNFLQPQTYVQPHVHPLPGQIELVSVLTGRIGFLLFDESGNITAKHDLTAGPCATIDIEPGIWHALVCLAPDTVILEAKQGPYRADSDKYFASWAPEEGAPGATEQLIRWIKGFDLSPKDFGL